jgi:hypothetical protein
MSSPSMNQNTYPWQNEPTWSKSEKAIARIAFDAALKRELLEVMQGQENQKTSNALLGAVPVFAFRKFPPSVALLSPNQR